jgi:hypothetical protein
VNFRKIRSAREFKQAWLAWLSTNCHIPVKSIGRNFAAQSCDARIVRLALGAVTAYAGKQMKGSGSVCR